MRTRYAAPALLAIAALALTGCVDNSTPSSGSSASSVGGVSKDARRSIAPARARSRRPASSPSASTPRTRPTSTRTTTATPSAGTSTCPTPSPHKLGVKTTYVDREASTTIIPSITGGKDDIGMSSFTDTVEREKQVDFVNYYSAGILWASAEGQDRRPGQRLRPQGRRRSRPRTRTPTRFPPSRRRAPTRARLPSRSSSSTPRTRRPTRSSSARPTR